LVAGLPPRARALEDELRQEAVDVVRGEERADRVENIASRRKIAKWRPVVYAEDLRRRVLGHGGAGPGKVLFRGHKCRCCDRAVGMGPRDRDGGVEQLGRRVARGELSQHQIAVAFVRRDVEH
jgi:hypothetical protein